ncbi:MAG: sterol desaturase family protein [Acidiferrobacterales bacterium]|nr:sterol desaturase family protein [Acidiferrobacterales bacterium]
MSRRPTTNLTIFRWLNNLGILALDVLLLRLVFPLLAVGFAGFLSSKGFGLFNLIELSGWLAFVATLLLLDLAIYLQHICFHKFPTLWRLHRVHHTDIEFDVSTGIRFHPFEMLLSMLIKLTVIALLGPPVLAVLVFEVMLNATSLFNHGNIRIPKAIDRWLRYVLVTPDMHRVHHSILQRETNSNFGFNLPVWDRLFGTYVAQPESGHENMTIGLEEHRSKGAGRLDKMLIQPFKS